MTINSFCCRFHLYMTSQLRRVDSHVYVELRLPPTGESNDGVQFVSGGADCLIHIWSISYDDVTSPRLSKLNTLVGHTGPVYCVKYNSTGETLASCGGDFTVRLWNMVSAATLSLSLSLSQSLFTGYHHHYSLMTPSHLNHSFIQLSMLSIYLLL